MGAFWSDHLFIQIIKLRLAEKKWLAKDSEGRTGIHSRVLTFRQHGYSKSSPVSSIVAHLDGFSGLRSDCTSDVILICI